MGSSLLWLHALVDTKPWPAACCRWPGGVHPNGYGTTRYHGRSIQAHRLAYTLAFGPVQRTSLVLHGKDGKRCESRACCNPAHLYAGTHQDNADDRERDGMTPRGATSGPTLHPERMARGDRNGSRLHPESRPRGIVFPAAVHKGVTNGRAKLTEAQVIEIRRRGDDGESKESLGRAFGVNGTMIGFIVRRKNWRHLPEPARPHDPE